MAFIAPVTASSPTATPTGVDGLAANSTIVSNGVDGSTTTPNPDTTGADAGLLYPFIDENDGLLKMFVDLKGNGINQIFAVTRIGQGKGVGGYALEATPSQTDPPVTDYISRFNLTDSQTLISKWQNYATDWATHTLPPDCIEGCFEYFLRDNKDLLDEPQLSNWAVWLRVNSHLSSPPPVTTPPPESDSSPTDSTLPASTGSGPNAQSLPTIGNFGPNGLPTIPVVSGTPDSPTLADPSNSTPAGPDPTKGTLIPVFDNNALKMYVKFNGGGNNVELTVDKIGRGGGAGGYTVNSPQTNVPLDSSWLPVSTFKISDLQTLISKWQEYPGDWATHTLPPSCSEGCFEYFLRDNIPLLDETVMNDYSKFLFTKGRLVDPGVPAMATPSSATKAASTTAPPGVTAPTAGPAEGGALPAQGGALPAQGGALPAQGGALPAQGGALPGQGGPLPAQGGPIPAQGGPIPAQGGSLPAQGGALPAQGGALPAQGGALPEEEGALPEEEGALPEEEGALPEEEGALPAEEGSLPAQGGALPAQGGALPAQGGALPAQGGGLPAQRGPHPVERGTLPAEGGSLPADAGAIPASYTPSSTTGAAGGPGATAGVTSPTAAPSYAGSTPFTGSTAVVPDGGMVQAAGTSV